MNNRDQLFMQRALALAQKGIGHVSPNPLVGCVIVHNDRIIGEGWHQKYGEAHAEVNAVRSVEDQSLLPESTVYVTLEPCSHYGKTPPCADMLISKQVKKVVIGSLDNNPLVGGQGIERIKKAGIEVVTGVLDEENRRLNKRFFHFIEHKAPYVILKWAQTKDSFVARENFDSKWISSEESRSLVHQWRAEEDAILVGKNTAKYDDPGLNVRSWEGRDPLRLVIDLGLELDSSLKLFNQDIPTVVYNSVKSEEKENLVYQKVYAENLVKDILDDLGQRKIQSVIIEGGAATIASFIKVGAWNEARIFKSAAEFGSGISAPNISGNLIAQSEMGQDQLEVYQNQDRK